MMKLVLLTVLISAALAVQKRQVGLPTPRPTGQQIRIIRLESDQSPDGNYKYLYETENGINAEEAGHLSGPGEDAGTVAQGSYRYTNPEGEVVEISYIADENGFQPVGNAIPVPPAIPDAIAKALSYNEAHPEQDNEKPSQTGQYTPSLPVSPQRSPSQTGQYSPIGSYTLG